MTSLKLEIDYPKGLMQSEQVVFYPMRSHLALVSATLRRLGSLRKPMPWCSLALTQDRMMKSFSLP